MFSHQSYFQYFSILLMSVGVIGFFVLLVALAIFLGPRHKTETKQSPFECGAIPVGLVRELRFNVRFYLVAVLFILFDIEIIFMYPWAITLEDLGQSAYFAMISFVFVLLGGFFYIWKKGVLDWND